MHPTVPTNPPSHPSLAPFDHQSRVRLIYGEGSVDCLGERVKEYGGTRALLVTDAGLAAAGHAPRAEAILRKAGLQAFIFDGVQENPTTRHVANCVDVAKKHDIDFIVGLGGGSSMDTAKGANFILSNGGKMADYWGVNKATKPMLPLIAVPTTAGTGSECQGFALIADDVTHQKMACGDEKAYAKAALLDPALTLSLPERVTANTGIDAVTHAMEAFVTAVRTPVSQLYAREAWRLLQGSLESVLREPRNIAARGEMLLGSAFAGLAIAESMLGAAHSCANPLTAHYNVIHGQAVGLMLPHVMRFNAQDAGARANYAQLAIAADLVAPNTPATDACAALLKRVEGLLNAAKIPRSLKECGVATEKIPQLSEDAAKQWTAQFNPRKVVASDFQALYGAALMERAI